MLSDNGTHLEQYRPCSPRVIPVALLRHIIPHAMALPFILSFAAVAWQRTWPTPPGMRRPDRTLVLYEILAANAGKISGLFNEHLAYSLKHLRAGTIVNLGISDTGAAAVFASTEWPEVEAIFNQDPDIREGVAAVASHTVCHACKAEN